MQGHQGQAGAAAACSMLGAWLLPQHAAQESCVKLLSSISLHGTSSSLPMPSLPPQRPAQLAPKAKFNQVSSTLFLALKPPPSPPAFPHQGLFL